MAAVVAIRKLASSHAAVVAIHPWRATRNTQHTKLRLAAPLAARRRPPLDLGTAQSFCNTRHLQARQTTVTEPTTMAKALLLTDLPPPLLAAICALATGAGSPRTMAAIASCAYPFRARPAPACALALRTGTAQVGTACALALSTHMIPHLISGPSPTHPH